MASALYAKGKAAIGGADIDLVNDSISALLVDLSAYTPDLSNDQYQDDIPEAAVVAEVLMAGKSFSVESTNAVFRADDTVFLAVATGSTVTGIVILKDTGELDTSPLICVFDTSGDFPITTDGTNITIEWDTGANGIFKI